MREKSKLPHRSHHRLHFLRAILRHRDRQGEQLPWASQGSQGHIPCHASALLSNSSRGCAKSRILEGICHRPSCAMLSIRQTIQRESGVSTRAQCRAMSYFFHFFPAHRERRAHRPHRRLWFLVLLCTRLCVHRPYAIARYDNLRLRYRMRHLQVGQASQHVFWLPNR